MAKKRLRPGATPVETRRGPSPTLSPAARLVLPASTGLATAPSVAGLRIEPQDTTALPTDRSGRSQGGHLASVIARVHPRYTDWLPVWTGLGHAYEGDGPYLDGSALIPHARELTYQRRADGSTDFTTVTGTKRKYQQRQQLAYYENFAATIVDLFVDYQYAKLPERNVDNKEGTGKTSEVEDWWKDVDGFGTSINDWCKRYQTLTNVFGHQFVVMDRQRTGTQKRTNLSPDGGKTRPSLADVGRPMLRVYSPPDVPDWLAPQAQLSAVKFSEAVERRSLLDTVLPVDRNYFLWDSTQWAAFNTKGVQLASSPHNMGELPVAVWYAKRRSRLPIIGRSLIRDAGPFKNHYNLLSELRELLRSQTFSMLNITLADGETIDQARERLGDHAGTDALVFTRGGAAFIAPPDGPATIYAAEIANAERKMFRLVGLPWDNDSREAEAAESRRIKAADLNASLASLADNAQEVDLWAARMFYVSRYGPERGNQRFQDASIRISHPDEFHVQQLMEAAEEAKLVLELGVGPTASRLIKANIIPLALRDLDAQTKQTIDEELQAEVEREQQHKIEMEKVERETGAATIDQTRATAETTRNPPIAASAAGARKPKKRKVTYDPATQSATVTDEE